MADYDYPAKIRADAAMVGDVISLTKSGTRVKVSSIEPGPKARWINGKTLDATEYHPAGQDFRIRPQHHKLVWLHRTRGTELVTHGDGSYTIQSADPNL